MIMETITRNKAIELVNSSKGKFFTITFVKKDNSQRRMTARTGVKIGVNGQGMKYNPSDYGMKSVYDMANLDWRMINFKTATRLKINKKDYVIE
jgi:hypothetical protein